MFFVCKKSDKININLYTTDVNNIILSKNTITNNAKAGATVGFLSTNAYFLVDNTATFSISANKLTANNPMSLTAGSLFNVGISTYDENSDTFSDFLTIIVTDNPVFSLDIDGNGSLAALMMD